MTDTTTLAAGRELDALVAEKVMGWVPGAGFANDTYWSFSTDIAAAWQVIEKMLNDGYGTSIADGPHGWSVAFGSTEKPFADADGDTPALAICRAALAALGAEVPHA